MPVKPPNPKGNEPPKKVTETKVPTKKETDEDIPKE